MHVIDTHVEIWKMPLRRYLREDEFLVPTVLRRIKF